MNYRVEFSDYLFEQLIPALNGKEVDVIISAITINDERKAKVLFSEPYFKSGLAIVVADDSEIKSVDSLKILDENLTQEEYGIAVRTDDKELLQKINAALQELKQSGEYQKIYDKWFAASK